MEGEDTQTQRFDIHAADPVLFRTDIYQPDIRSIGGNVTPDAATTCHHRLRNSPATEFALLCGLQGRMQTSCGGTLTGA